MPENDPFASTTYISSKHLFSLNQSSSNPQSSSSARPLSWYPSHYSQNMADRTWKGGARVEKQPGTEKDVLYSHTQGHFDDVLDLSPSISHSFSNSMLSVDVPTPQARRPPHSDSSPSSTSPSSALSGFGASLPSAVAGAHNAASRSRRPRKEKPHIALAPDQPPTTQGKPRTRVFVACVQCRGRKIRCDGAKPICFNCMQRTNPDSECNYDPAPKRRGPDKVQGARTRSARSKDDYEEPVKRRRRRTTNASDVPAESSKAGDHGPQAALPSIMAKSFSEIHDRQSDSTSYSPPNLISLPRINPSLLGHPGSNVRYTSDMSFDQGPLTPIASGRAAISSHQQLEASRGFDIVMPNIFISNTGPIAHNLSVDGTPDDEQTEYNVIAEPSLQFTRKVWWDHLVTLYTSFLHGTAAQTHTRVQRDVGAQRIVNDLRFLFRTSSYWFSFINVPRFYNNFLNPAKRSVMQPSLVLASLAVSIYLQSSELGMGQEGRRMALKLRDEAQGMLQASLNARWVDESLAQAAWILAFFEVCAHPDHLLQRVDSALAVMDSVIRTLSLTYLDLDNPQASAYARHAVPAIPWQQYQATQASDQKYPASNLGPIQQPPATQWSSNANQSVFSQSHNPGTYSKGCTCDSLSLGQHWPEAHEQTPLWLYTPAWNREWTEWEVKKEECRRLAWSAMTLAAGYSAYTAAIGFKLPELFVIDPANYTLLFPGEALLLSQSYLANNTGKETVWALYLRAMLLWHSCLSLRMDTSTSEADKADFAIRAWLETEAIEEALNKHICGVERSSMYSGREYLFNTRMCISFEFRRFIPHALTGPSREKSIEWLREQERRAKAVMQGMHAVTGNIKHNLSQRPWFVWWFMGQVSRALTLWSFDSSLVFALDVCKAFLEPIDFLTSIYPCQEQRRRYDELLERVRRSCLLAGVSPPAHTYDIHSIPF